MISKRRLGSDSALMSEWMRRRRGRRAVEPWRRSRGLLLLRMKKRDQAEQLVRPPDETTKRGSPRAMPGMGAISGSSRLASAVARAARSASSRTAAHFSAL
jgi:hypothetical protein